MTAPHVLLFDLYAGGHHGQYVRQLVEFWGTSGLQGRLTILASPAFFAQHKDVVQLASQYASVGARCIPITVPLRTRSGLAGLLLHGRVLQKYIRELRPTHAVCMYFDQVQLSLVLGLRFDFPLALSGIYFRPTFHYSRLGGRTLGNLVTDTRKRALLHLALRNPHFRTLFCLDPYVIPYVDDRHAQIVPLPDGAPEGTSCRANSAYREQWGIERSRRTALFFGSIAKRKGIYQALSALTMLPEEKQKQLALIIVGRTSEEEAARVRRQVSMVRKATRVQIIHEERFVDEEEIPGLFAASDLALLPYQRHVGSSGILIRAAQAGIPVLGTNYGLIGRHLQSRQLGMAVDTTDPAAIASGLAGWLANRVSNFDLASAKAFGAANTAKKFSETIYGAMFSAASAPSTTRSAC